MLLAHLSDAGADVIGLSRNVEMASAVNEGGLTVITPGERRQVPTRVVTELPDVTYDIIITATQPTDVVEAATRTRPFLADDGRFIILQNGLCEWRVAEAFGESRSLVGGIVSWGASSIAPGVVEMTSRGGFTLGTLNGDPVPESLGLSELLSCVGPVASTENLLWARWSKLILNSVVSSLGTLNGSHLGAVVRSRVARRLGLEIITESVEVARAAGVRLEMVAGTLDLERVALDSVDRWGGLLWKHALLLLVGAKYRKMKSSLLRAIEAGKPPAVDFLNGEVVRWGAQHGVGTPINEAICHHVHEFARGAISPGPAVIAHLAGLAAERKTTHASV